MSRSFNDHKKAWFWPGRDAKKWSNKNRRTHGKRLIKELEKAVQSLGVEVMRHLMKK